MRTGRRSFNLPLGIEIVVIKGPSGCAFKENEMAGFIVGYQTKARGYVELDGQQIKFWEGIGPMTFSGTLDEFATAHPAVVEEMVQHLIIRPRAVGMPTALD